MLEFKKKEKIEMKLGEELKNISLNEIRKKPEIKFKKCLEDINEKYKPVSIIKNDIISRAKAEAEKGNRSLYGTAFYSGNHTEIELFDRSTHNLSERKKKKILNEIIGNELIRFCKENNLILYRFEIFTSTGDLDSISNFLKCFYEIRW